MICTYRLSFSTVNELLHGLKAEYCFLDPLEQRPGPADGACHWRLILSNGRGVLVCDEQVIDDVHLCVIAMC